ncbi:MAG: GtrA family protein [Clostridia bacterium]|nr:GtrA family protein [Clostridia bacterium]
MIEKIKTLIIKNRELILYLIFGVATTLVNWTVYTVLVEALSVGMTVANALSWLVAVIFAFAVNKLIVFESKHLGFLHLTKELGAFFLGRLLSGAVEIFLPLLLYKIGLTFALFGIEGFLAKVSTSVIVIILNYIFSKLIVFRKRKEN